MWWTGGQLADKLENQKALSGSSLTCKAKVPFASSDQGNLVNKILLHLQ